MKKLFLIVLSIICLLTVSLADASPWITGIYLTQSSLQDANALHYYIRQAKATGINTFVIDYGYYSHAYARNIKIVKNNGIRYVARIIVFPGGGTDRQVLSKSYWETKYRLVQQAAAFGANAIQLDYVRYRSSQRASSQNARNIYQVIKWFKQKCDQLGVPLEIDVFGETTFGASRHIGQNLKVFAPVVDAMCPMLYPSHYEPYLHYSRRPYQTVYESLQALKAQFNHRVPFRIYAFIETSNYRMRQSNAQKVEYIYKQIKAVQDAGANGWYAWSARNQYNNLFYMLRNYRVR